jgi:hypothetical protein
MHAVRPQRRLSVPGQLQNRLTSLASSPTTPAITVARAIPLACVSGARVLPPPIAREAATQRLTPASGLHPAAAVAVTVFFVVAPVPVAPVVTAVVDALRPVPHGALAIEVAPPPFTTARHWRVLHGQVLDDVQVNDAPAPEAAPTAFWDARHTRWAWQGDPANERHQSRALDPRPDTQRLGVLASLALVFNVVQGAGAPDRLLG